MKRLYRQWQKPRRHQLRSAAPVAWCQRRSPWIPLPCPWMSAGASWPCFARETGLNSNTKGSLSTKLSQSITLDSGSFPVVIVSTFRSMQSGNLLINTNPPHCLFWESILHTLVITAQPLVVRNGHTADTHIPVLCQQSTVRWLSFHYIDAVTSSRQRRFSCPKEMSKAYCYRRILLFKIILIAQP